MASSTSQVPTIAGTARPVTARRHASSNIIACCNGRGEGSESAACRGQLVEQPPEVERAIRVRDEVAQPGAPSHRPRELGRDDAVLCEHVEMLATRLRQLPSAIRDDVRADFERVLKREEEVERDHLLRRSIDEERIARL